MNAVETEQEVVRAPRIADKARLRRILEEQDQATGFVFDPTATPQRTREFMIEYGIRPEDNSFSRELRKIRDVE